MTTMTKPAKGTKRGKGKGARKRHRRTAETSDKQELYELSVQEPEAECDLIDQVWTEQRSRKCLRIREDFCGSGAVAMEWVKRRTANTAIGVDIDQSVLEWARAKATQRLNPAQAKRLTMLRSDVRTVEADPVDSVLAMNFSYYLLRTREDMRTYFRQVHRSLVDDGIFLLDAYGGSDAFVELEEDREVEGFTYVWDQHSYNPITGEAVNHIHFRFPDGSCIKNAFTYHWRLWTLPEIQEVLVEAGFSDVVVYWEGTDEDGEGNGEWEASRTGEACPGWIAYIAGLK
jgi:SAM-dependent methyltransferase